MTGLHRVQQRRAAGWRKPSNTASVAAPTRWQNPWRPDPVPFYLWLLGRGPRHDRPTRPCITAHELLEAAEAHLVGQNLMCFCSVDRPCHADIWLAAVNDLPDLEWLVVAGTQYHRVTAPTLTHAAIHVHLLRPHALPLELLRPRLPTESERERMNWAEHLGKATAKDRRHYLMREL